jgi:O-antigen/teichoic acid export membrane protein
MDLKNRVMSGLRWTAGMRLLGQLVTWVVTILVIRLLSPADYGLMSLAGVFVAFLAMINELGLGAAIVQRKDIDLKMLKSLFGFVLVVSVLFCCLLSLAASPIAEFYNEPKLVLMLRILSLIFILSGVAVLPQSILLRELQYRKIAVIDFFSAIVGSVTTLMMALNGMGVWSLVGGILTIRFTAMVGLHLTQPFFHLPTFKLKGMGPIFSFSGNVTLSRILWFIYSTAAASLIVGKILGKDLLGVFAIALYLACLPMEKVGGIINQVAFPAFSSVQEDPQLAGAHFLKAVRTLSFFTIPIFWGMSSIAPEIVGVFLGEKWRQASLPLQLIAVVIPLRMVRNLMTPATLGLGRSDVSLYIEIVAVILMPLAFFVASFKGLTAVSLVWVLIFPVVFAINLIQVVDVVKIKFIDIIKSMYRPAAYGLVMYVVLFFIRYYFFNQLTMFLRMVLFMFIGSIIYSTMVLMFDKKTFKEIMSLVKT